jgi:hypothetical protein
MVTDTRRAYFILMDFFQVEPAVNKFLTAFDMRGDLGTSLSALRL